MCLHQIQFTGVFMYQYLYTNHVYTCELNKLQIKKHKEL